MGCNDRAGVGLCPQVARRVVLADGGPISGKSDRRLWVHGSSDADFWWDTSALAVGFPIRGAFGLQALEITPISNPPASPGRQYAFDFYVSMDADARRR